MCLCPDLPLSIRILVMIREGEILYDIPYMWNLKRNDTNELTSKTERDSDLENELMVAQGMGGTEGQLGCLGWTYTHCYILNG